MGQVVGIYIAPTAGAEMVSLSEAAVVEGAGIRDDRYAQGIGHFQNTGPENRRNAIRHLSIISAGAIVRAQQESGVMWTSAMTRRNIVVSGISPEELNELETEEFSLGGIAVWGVELCTPCPRPSQLSGQEGFRAAFNGIGGLRVQVLDSGLLKVGDSLVK